MPDYHVTFDPGYLNSIQQMFGTIQGPAGYNFTYRFDSTTNAAQRAFMREAMTQWTDVANLHFTEQTNGQLLIRIETLEADVGGSVNVTGPSASVLKMDSDYAAEMRAGEVSTDYGWAYSTAVHELGHVVGLSHPGPYNAGNGNPSPADAVFYEDTTAYSVMSYWDPDRADTQAWTSIDFSFDGSQPLTPMVLDVYYTQLRYGANTTSRMGNETYFFNSNAGMAFSVSDNSDGFAGLIYDNGGYDTLDLSGSFEAQNVTLAAPGLVGARDDISELGTWNSVLGRANNLFIWHSTVIERILGGHGDDIFTARDGVNTTLNGGGGADMLQGGSGNDTLTGGDDTDSDHLWGGAGHDSFVINAYDSVNDYEGDSEVAIYGTLDPFLGEFTYVSLGDGNDIVNNFGTVIVDVELNGGLDEYNGSSGEDRVHLVIGGATAGNGDAISLGGGSDHVIATFGGDWGSGQDVVAGGGGFDTFVANFAVDISITNLTTGVTDLGSLNDRLLLTGFESIEFKAFKTKVASPDAVSLSTDTIQTGGRADSIELRYDSPYNTVLAGEGDDFVSTNIDNIRADRAIGDHPGNPFAAVNRNIDLGGGNDVLFANLLSLGTQIYRGGDGFDTLDLGELGAYWFDQLTYSTLRLSNQAITVNDAAGSMTVTGTKTDSTGYVSTASIEGFESYTLLNRGHVTFEGNATQGRTVTLTSTLRYWEAQKNLPSDVDISFGTGADTLVVEDLNSRRLIATQPAGQFTFQGSGGQDVLDFSDLRSVYEGIWTALINATGSRESFTIDAAAGTFLRTFDYGFATPTFDNRAEGLISGFETYYLPDYEFTSQIPTTMQIFAVTLFNGAATAETVYGGAQDDRIKGNGGRDTLLGGGGDDSVSGGGGDDLLQGGGGKDVLNGASGRDTITGGADRDIMTGGTASDSFRFAAGDTGQTAATLDRITDFEKGALLTGDRIDFSAALSTIGASTTANANRAAVDAATGVASFYGNSGKTLADALADISASLSTGGDLAGEMALFRVNAAGAFHLFISDGEAGLGPNDVVVQLANIDSVSSIALSNGDLTILT